jgi:hypothetical protein
VSSSITGKTLGAILQAQLLLAQDLSGSVLAGKVQHSLADRIESQDMYLLNIKKYESQVIVFCRCEIAFTWLFGFSKESVLLEYCIRGSNVSQSLLAFCPLLHFRLASMKLGISRCFSFSHFKEVLVDMFFFGEALLDFYLI